MEPYLIYCEDCGHRHLSSARCVPGPPSPPLPPRFSHRDYLPYASSYSSGRWQSPAQQFDPYVDLPRRHGREYYDSRASTSSSFYPTQSERRLRESFDPPARSPLTRTENDLNLMAIREARPQPSEPSRYRPTESNRSSSPPPPRRALSPTPTESDPLSPEEELIRAQIVFLQAQSAVIGARKKLGLPLELPQSVVPGVSPASLPAESSSPVQQTVASAPVTAETPVPVQPTPVLVQQTPAPAQQTTASIPVHEETPASAPAPAEFPAPAPAHAPAEFPAIGQQPPAPAPVQLGNPQASAPRAQPAVTRLATRPRPMGLGNFRRLADVVAAPPNPGRDSAAKRAELKTYLLETAVPYTHTSQVATDIVLEFGDGEFTDMECEPHQGGVWREMPTPAKVPAESISQGMTRYSVYPELRLQCKKCRKNHPTDTCGHLFQVAARIYDRDTTRDDFDPEYECCVTCHHEGNTKSARQHFSASHGKAMWYEHPENKRLEEIVLTAQNPAEVMTIIPYYVEWPSKLQKREPLPAYCYFPKVLKKPSWVPYSLEDPLLPDLTFPDETIPDAVKRVRDATVKRSIRSARGGSSRGGSFRGSSNRGGQSRSNNSAATGRGKGNEEPSSFGKALVHPKLKNAGVKPDGIYVIEASFMDEIDSLLIEEHKPLIYRLRDLVKHYVACWERFGEDKSLRKIIVSKNDLLWRETLRYYAECWAPQLRKLDSIQETEFRARFERVRAKFQQPSLNGWELMTDVVLPEKLDELCADLPKNPCLALPEPQKPQEKPAPVQQQPEETIMVNRSHPEAMKILKGHVPGAAPPASLRRFFENTDHVVAIAFAGHLANTYDDPCHDCEYHGGIVGSAPTSDDEVYNFIIEFGLAHQRMAEKHCQNLETWVNFYDEKLDLVNFDFGRTDPPVQKAIAEHREEMKRLATNLFNAHEDFTAGDPKDLGQYQVLSQMIEDNWTAYDKGILAAAGKLLATPEARVFFESHEGLTLWPLMMCWLMPVRHPDVGNPQRFVWPRLLNPELWDDES